jgi:thiamine biosynthesis protein ThiS
MALISVNDKPIDVDHYTNVKALLKKLNTAISGIAVAVNSKLISPTQWQDTILQDGDKVLIITATAGG